MSPPLLTPSKYWRVAYPDPSVAPSASAFQLPESLTKQGSPPRDGEGLILADYDEVERTGYLSYLGVIKVVCSGDVQVDWQPTAAAIWVDSAAGVGNWKGKPGFAFAATKVAGYGLHALFAKHFEGLEPRENAPHSTQPKRARASRLPAERLNPMEVIGTPSATPSPRSGYVYVLESVHGYKIGRTRRLPDRMRTFAVKLPIAYTIPFCLWFADCVEAESRYHRQFAQQRINGEWFDLSPAEVESVRQGWVAA